MQNQMLLFHLAHQVCLPTRIYSKCKNPARAMIGHPFNPVYMCPGVEIVPGKKTKREIFKQSK